MARAKDESKPEPNRDALAEYAAAFARLGGQARAKTLTSDQRRAIAKKAAAARWRKSRKPK